MDFVYWSTAALYIPSCQVPHTHAEVSHLSTASCTYRQRRLCRRDGLSCSHEGNSSNSSKHQHNSTNCCRCCCCCCCCVQPQPQHQQQHYRSSSTTSIAVDNMSACSIRSNYCEYRTRCAYCTGIYTRIIYVKYSIVTTGSNRSI